MSRSIEQLALPAQCGQAAIEVFALAPVVFVTGLICMQGFAAGANVVTADRAAHSAAVALLKGDAAAARRAASRALPAWSRGRVFVTGAGRRVTVRLRPRALLPGLASLLETESTVALAAEGPRRP